MERKSKNNLIGTYILILVLAAANSVLAQGKQAVVLMRAGSAASAPCDGTAEINHQVVYDLKLNNNDGIRLFSSGPGGAVSRKSYEDALKNKLVNMYQFKWQDDFLYALSASGQTPLLVLPEDMKPQKNVDQPVNSFYAAMFSGEARDGKQKRKISLALRDVWKIYFIPEGGNINEVFFNHALEEKSVIGWEAYLKKTGNSYRVDEANGNMRDSLIDCARSSVDQFLNGDYKALDVAKQRTERAQSIKPDEVTGKLMSEIGQHKKRVTDSREQFYQLVSASRWDDAITSAAPIKIYLSGWDDLNALYTKSLDESHNLHLSKGKQAMESGQLDAAKSECTIAWQRHPDSNEARACVCISRNRIALRDSGAFRQRKQPKEAKQLLEQQLEDSDCAQDPAIVKELGIAKCEYSQQLFGEAQKLTSGPGGAAPAPGPARARKAAAPAAGVSLKNITAQNKKDFRDAREKLILAGEMCPEDGASALLDKVNRSLASFTVAEAKKALLRGDSGTAYVYLMSGEVYTPGSEGLTMLLNQARAEFEEKTHVNVGVAFNDRSNDRYGASILHAVSSEIESNATRVGLAQPVILDSDQAARALRAVQAGTGLPSPTALFSGDLLAANVRVTATDRTVRSYYQVDNPEYKRRDEIHDATVDEYKGCKRVNGEAACVGLENRMKEQKRWRDSVPLYLRYEYNYYERQYRVTGGARLTFRYMDSITRSALAAETFDAAVGDECTARSGVDSRDGSARDAECNQIQDESRYVDSLITQLQTSASARAYTILRDLPGSFYKRAKSSTNRQHAVEDFLQFLFLTSEKRGEEAEDAKRFLTAFDAELTTDGVLR